MATYNGAEFLPEQLESFLQQSVSNWVLHVSDDGSQDATAQVLTTFRDRAARLGHQVRLGAGPQNGAAANFLHLLQSLDANPGWLAFADQDDIWLPDRLERGLRALHDLPGPGLFCSRTWIFAGSDPTSRRLSAPRPRAFGFRNALVQNIASGNTILLNPAAAALVQSAAVATNRVVVHDWWVYQLITGVGGRVVHDDAPTLYYRQHGSNGIGANDTLSARIQRLGQLLRGDFKTWNEVNIAALEQVAPQLSPENRTLLQSFAESRRQPLLRRLATLSGLGLYRQSRPATLALWLAAVLGRL